MKNKLIDHLFRHHYGKMVSVLTRIFGLRHLETIEDAVQDTFIKASLKWKQDPPENPEAWLTTAAKNRVLDIFRKLTVEKKHVPRLESGREAIAVQELFLDSEIADSQLRMIFTACHPELASQDRIAFALKTISGFSSKEIASALLTKEETIKKRLSRARKVIRESDIQFKIPQGPALPERLDSVLEVLYLIFNEGFHSNKKEILVRKELCGEAIRLCKLLLKNKLTRNGKAYALFACMCFHASRLDAKTNSDNELLDLRSQDRSLWYFPLIAVGNEAMNKAVANGEYSTYHFEAAIASEHLKASNFEETDWDVILSWYERLHAIQPMPIHILNMAVVQILREDFEGAFDCLSQISAKDLGQRAYLYHGTMAEYHYVRNSVSDAIESINKALELVTNEAEKQHLHNRKLEMLI